MAHVVRAILGDAVAHVVWAVLGDAVAQVVWILSKLESKLQLRFFFGIILAKVECGHSINISKIISCGNAWR